jgi:hypothetical protein
MKLLKHLAAVAFVAAAACQAPRPASHEAPDVHPPRSGPVAVAAPAQPRLSDEAFLHDLERRTFTYFHDLARRDNGLVPDRAPTPSFSSIAAVGFALTAWPIGAERGWISRDEALDRTLAALRFFDRAPQGPAARGTAGYKGFYYHFLDMATGERFEQVELSSIDTTLLVAGALFAQEYFDRAAPAEAEVRELAERLYRRIEWPWLLARPPRVAMGWHPESGMIAYDWQGLNEAALLYVLALGSPTHPIDPAAWEAYTSTYRWGEFYGYEQVNFAPLFGHHYSHAWIDFRGISDPWMRGKGIDYFENSRRAALSQQAYAIANPDGWVGYGAELWGLSACDGPLDGDLRIDGRRRHFFTYAARGAAAGEIRDDGTLTPAAAAGSLPFAPEIALPTLRAMHERFGEHLSGRWGFFDAFNLTLRQPVAVRHGKVVPGVGWFDTDALGIDQGISLVMIENHRSGLLWERMRRNPHLIRGLRRAGFTGGWLDAAAHETPGEPPG